jgi:cytochrome c-type biogenesis protein
MNQLVLEYYRIISGLFNALASPIQNLAGSMNLPLVSALLFGLLGAAAPCQLSTSVAAVAFLSRRADDGRKLLGQTLAFVAGKVTVYALLGGVIVALGLQINQITETAVPVVVFARRALGPLLVVVGLFMLGVLASRLSVGERISTWLYQKAGRRRGLAPAYLMGLAFAFTFCPTLFWLFFGLTIPLAIASPGGIVFPGVFAIGTTLPVLVLAVLAFQMVNVGQLVGRFRSASVWTQRAVGIVFILIGINEIILYWMI